MITWYVLEAADSTAPIGPFALTEMLRLVSEGRLRPETRVARAGAKEWSPASADAELAALFAGVDPAQLMPLAEPYSFSNAFDLGFSTFKSQWGMLVVVSLIGLALSAALQAPLQIAQFFFMGASQGGGGMDGALAAIGGLIFLVGFAIACVGGILLQAGLNYAGARAARKQLQVMDLFAGFKRFGAVLWTGILTAALAAGGAIVLLAPMLIGIGISAATEEPAPFIVGIIISVPLIVAALAFFSVFLSIPLTLVVDDRMRARAGFPALSLAWHLGKGISLSYFALLLVVGLIASLSILCLCIGYFLIGIPLLLATQGAAYHLITAPYIARGRDHRCLQ